MMKEWKREKRKKRKSLPKLFSVTRVGARHFFLFGACANIISKKEGAVYKVGRALNFKLKKHAQILLISKRGAKILVGIAFSPSSYLSKSAVMNTTLNRFNAVSALATSVLMALAAFTAIMTYPTHKPSGRVAIKELEV